MTGKEALEKMLATLKYWQGRNTIFDKAQGDCILKELELLTKYKRAFEILKRELDIRCSDGTVWFFKCIGETDIIKEEYELLEELMNNEHGNIDY